VKKRILIFIGILILVVGLILTYNFSYLKYLQWKYDSTHQNPKINQAAEIDNLFKSFKTIPFKQLPEAIKSSTHANQALYKKLLAKEQYIVLSRDDLMKRMVKNYRLSDFVAHDKMFYTALNTNSLYYTCLKPEILKTFLALLIRCEEKGYDIREITLRSGHRHPALNYLIGGASQSRHLFGDAIDIGVSDINNDGKANAFDKELILNLLENELIGNKGGIGLYPNTKAVHFDLRGHKARWNSYTPAFEKKN
jgi:uncharacterized protein YcbK (DUF882 family)